MRCSPPICRPGVVERPRRAPYMAGTPIQEIPMATTTVTDTSFEQDVLGAEKPVLVDFWAEWCGPCRMIAPALEELSDELGDRVTIVKLNIDENPAVPTKYGVRGIPTMILFKNGQPAATKVGAEPKSRIQGWLEGVL